MRPPVVLMVAFCFLPVQVFAIDSEVVFQQADKLTQNIVAKLLSAEMKEAGSFSGVPPIVMTSSSRVSKTPFLFVVFRDGYHCGNVNCEIWGFEQTKTGWREVLQGNGEKWTVLKHVVGDHHDIAEMHHGSATDNPVSILRWNGIRYRRISH